MPTTIFGSQFFSGLGAELGSAGSFTAVCASQDIDLASQILPAGNYSLTVNVVMGQVCIYVPESVSTIIDGTVLFGTASSHRNGNGWKRYRRFFHTSGASRNGSPSIAFADTSGQVRRRITIAGFLGVVRIYRLEREAEMFRPGIVAVGA